MSETVGGAVERVQGPGALIEAQAAEFAKVLPSHLGADRFQRWALSCVRNPDIAEVMQHPAGQLSVMAALMDCASLGLEPGRTYHLAVFKGLVSGIIDYRGEIELMYRANQDSVVVASLVHERDKFQVTGADSPPVHEAEWFADRGPVTGGYAYQRRGEVCSMVVLMSEADFLVHRAAARTVKIWDAHPEPMRLKTLVHQLRKFVPWSTEWV